MALRRLLILFAALALTCGVGAAQTVTGTISGAVLDQSDVALQNDQTGASRKIGRGAPPCRVGLKFGF